MFFGLTNSPPTFQSFMDDGFKDLVEQGNLSIYMDNCIIGTKGSLTNHIKEVTKVLQRMDDLELFFRPSKCTFHTRTVNFLGFIIGEGTV